MQPIHTSESIAIEKQKIEYAKRIVQWSRNPGIVDYARGRTKELEAIWPGFIELVKKEMKNV
jgi:hypothetical protein